MIHFFRKIRKSLLGAGAFRKYLIYAMGEILLVVFGILLALYLNNLNQTRIEAANIDAKFLAIQEELLDNIWECKFWYEFNEYKDSLITLIVDRKLGNQDYLDNPQYAQLLTFIHDIDLHDHEFKNLTAVSDKIPDRFMNTYQNLVRLNNDRGVDVLNNDDLLQDYSNRKADEWSLNKDWFADLYNPELSDDILNYMVLNYKYVNEVVRYEIYYINAMITCMLYIQDAVKCYESIEAILNPGRESHELILEAKSFLKRTGDNFFNHD